MLYSVGLLLLICEYADVPISLGHRILVIQHAVIK